VVAYLRFIDGCNAERNARLRRQLIEVVTALNLVGIVPLLLKGAVPLILSTPPPNRITSDLDIAVAPAEEPRARERLGSLDYEQAIGSGEMIPRAGGAIVDLRSHRGDKRYSLGIVEHQGLQVWIPTVEARALHWIVHDLVKEGDYWRGRIDLRHMVDLVQLAQSEGVDWTAVRAAASTRAARTAVDVQLLALEELFGTPIPEACRKSVVVRIQHRRRMFAVRHTVLGAPLRISGSLIWMARRVLTTDDIWRTGKDDLLRRGHRFLFERRSKI
jgi:hypothetical protein